jgi:hypothetical protein
MSKELVKLALDLKKGKITNYTKDEANEVLRQELIELNGGSDKLNPKSFRKYPEMFEIIEQILDISINEGLQGQFNDFVETVQLDWGDTMVFTLPENRLFDVSIVADGNGDLRRDRLDSSEVTVKTKTYGVAIYEELHRLLAGRVSFDRMIDIVSRSYENKIQNEIYNAVYNSFDQLNATYRATGTFAEATLVDLISHVEASTGAEAVVLGTKSALSRVTRDRIALDPTFLSETMRDEINRIGYVGMFNGTPLVEIKNTHRVGTTQWAIDNNFLIVAPTGLEPFVKLIFEGDSLVEEVTEGRKDMQREYRFIKKAGFNVLVSENYGIYRLD